jgi:diguanylate cyclase (GGDEF)-like protein
MSAALVLAAVIAATLLVAVRATLLYESHAAVLNHAREANRNLVLLAQRIVERDISACTRALQTLESATSPLNAEVMRTCLSRFVTVEGTGAPVELAQAVVIDADGNIVESSLSQPPCSPSLASEAFFTHHRDTTQRGVYVSAPFRSCLLRGVPAIALSHRLSGPNGAFGGVALIVIDLSDFSQLFAGLAPGAHGAIEILRNDGVPIVSEPFVRGNLDASRGNAELFRRFTVHPGGDFIEHADMDVDARLYTYRYLSGTPLLIVAATSTADIFADWRRRAIQVSLLTAALATACVLLSILLIQQRRRRRQVELELEHMASTDMLTQLPNRRALDETFANEWARAARESADLAVLFIDVDYFKAYNDRYGHVAGDAALATVARVIARALRRPGDTVGRYGGEEFMVVLPRTPLHAAVTLAEEIREAVRRCNIPHADNAAHKLTVSIGVATCVPSHGGDAYELVREADAALYAAKDEGRDRVWSRAFTDRQNETPPVQP